MAGHSVLHSQGFDFVSCLNSLRDEVPTVRQNFFMAWLWATKFQPVYCKCSLMTLNLCAEQGDRGASGLDGRPGLDGKPGSAGPPGQRVPEFMLSFYQTITHLICREQVPGACLWVIPCVSICRVILGNRVMLEEMWVSFLCGGLKNTIELCLLK